MLKPPACLPDFPLLPKHLRPVKIWTPEVLWLCPLVSGTNTSAAYPVSPVGWPPCIGLPQDFLLVPSPAQVNDTRTRQSTWCKNICDLWDHCFIVQFWHSYVYLRCFQQSTGTHFSTVCAIVSLLWDWDMQATFCSPGALVSFEHSWPSCRTVFGRYWPPHTGDTPQELLFWRCSGPVI